VITNDVSDYISLLIRIAHIICNQPFVNVCFYFGGSLTLFASVRVFF